MSYQKKYDINYYNCDQNLELSIISLLRFFEDIAITHSDSVNLGFKFYNESKVAWYLTRWKIDVHALPVFNQTITIKTNPKSFFNFYANREYFVFDEKDNLMITANTLWVFLDSESHKPKKIPESVYKGYGLDDDGHKYFSKLNEIVLPIEFDSLRQFQILQRDIDYNNHMNNSQYVSFAFETIEPDFFKDYRLINLEVNYLKEAYLNDKIIVSSSKKHDEGITFYHRISKADSELCKIKSQWKLR